MSNCAYPSSYTHDSSDDHGGVVHGLGTRVKERFSRQSKPIDHLGNLNPEDRIPARVDLVRHNTPLYNPDREINIWPQEGSSHEDMEICVG